MRDNGEAVYRIPIGTGGPAQLVLTLTPDSQGVQCWLVGQGERTPVLSLSVATLTEVICGLQRARVLVGWRRRGGIHADPVGVAEPVSQRPPRVHAPSHRWAHESLAGR